MKNKTTQNRNGRKEEATRLKWAIVDLLRVTEMEYNQLQYEEGLKYLNAYLEEDSHNVSLMEGNRIFWNWWRNHWTNRDESFMTLHRQNPIRRTEIARQLYTQYNRGIMLAKSIHPNAVVLNDSYAKMITELVDGETQKV